MQKKYKPLVSRPIISLPSLSFHFIFPHSNASISQLPVTARLLLETGMLSFSYHPPHLSSCVPGAQISKRSRKIKLLQTISLLPFPSSNKSCWKRNFSVLFFTLKNHVCIMCALISGTRDLGANGSGCLVELDTWDVLCLHQVTVNASDFWSLCKYVILGKNAVFQVIKTILRPIRL